MSVLGACSWSLRPTGPEGLASALARVGVSAVQLALDPLRRGDWDTNDTAGILEADNIEIRSGMMTMQGEDYSTLDTIRRTGGVRVDEHWPANLRAAEDNARVAARLGVELVTFHGGFIPEDHDDPQRSVMIDRIRQIHDRFAAEGVRVALETGQETATTLLEALDALDRPKLGVNFDPANMILYSMGDPIAALDELAPRVAQIHIKDALETSIPGTWGIEVPVGDGEVDWAHFFEACKRLPKQCDFMIEREAGESRLPDVLKARRHVEGYLS